MTFSKYWGDKSTSVPSTQLFGGDDPPLSPLSLRPCQGVLESAMDCVGRRCEWRVSCVDNVHYMHTAQLISALADAGIHFRQNVSYSFYLL